LTLILFYITTACRSFTIFVGLKWNSYDSISIQNGTILLHVICLPWWIHFDRYMHILINISRCTYLALKLNFVCLCQHRNNQTYLCFLLSRKIINTDFNFFFSWICSINVRASQLDYWFKYMEYWACSVERSVNYIRHFKSDEQQLLLL
jgi:hypothetical protein